MKDVGAGIAIGVTILVSVGGWVWASTVLSIETLVRIMYEVAAIL